MDPLEIEFVGKFVWFGEAREIDIKGFESFFNQKTSRKWMARNPELTSINNKQVFSLIIEISNLHKSLEIIFDRINFGEFMKSPTVGGEIFVECIYNSRFALALKIMDLKEFDWELHTNKLTHNVTPLQALIGKHPYWWCGDRFHKHFIEYKKLLQRFSKLDSRLTPVPSYLNREDDSKNPTEYQEILMFEDTDKSGNIIHRDAYEFYATISYSIFNEAAFDPLLEEYPSGIRARNIQGRNLLHFALGRENPCYEGALYIHKLCPSLIFEVAKIDQFTGTPLDFVLSYEESPKVKKIDEDVQTKEFVRRLVGNMVDAANKHRLDADQMITWIDKYFSILFIRDLDCGMKLLEINNKEIISPSDFFLRMISEEHTNGIEFSIKILLSHKKIDVNDIDERTMFDRLTDNIIVYRDPRPIFNFMDAISTYNPTPFEFKVPISNYDFLDDRYVDTIWRLYTQKWYTIKIYVLMHLLTLGYYSIVLRAKIKSNSNSLRFMSLVQRAQFPNEVLAILANRILHDLNVDTLHYGLVYREIEKNLVVEKK